MRATYERVDISQIQQNRHFVNILPFLKCHCALLEVDSHSHGISSVKLESLNMFKSTTLG